MRRLALSLSLSLVLTATPWVASAGPTVGGFASDNVEWVGYVPFEAGGAVGARVFDGYLYVTGVKSVSVYDISTPESPQLLDIVPTGYEGNPLAGPLAFENEDVDTNGKILLFAQGFVLGGPLVIFDVEDKTNVTEIARIPGFGQHTVTCAFDCKWAYGSDGAIVDLRDPSEPRVVAESPVNGHDMTEVSPGVLLCSCGGGGLTLLDARKNPRAPKAIAFGAPIGGAGGSEYVHSNLWPKGKDHFVVTTTETWVPGVDSDCGDHSGGIQTWDASKVKKTHTFKLIDNVKPKQGMVVDGNPAVNYLGCSAHWSDTHPDFKNGGLVTGGFYNHGTRFFEVNKKGKIAEVGYYLPATGATWASYWASDDIVYGIDFERGIDILRFKDA